MRRVRRVWRRLRVWWSTPLPVVVDEEFGGEFVERDPWGW